MKKLNCDIELILFIVGAVLFISFVVVTTCWETKACETVKDSCLDYGDVLEAAIEGVTDSAV